MTNDKSARALRVELDDQRELVKTYTELLDSARREAARERQRLATERETVRRLRIALFDAQRVILELGGDLPASSGDLP